MQYIFNIIHLLFKNDLGTAKIFSYSFIFLFFSVGTLKERFCIMK